MEGETCIRDVGMLRGKGRNEGTKAMEKVKKQLRSVLIPHKNGLLLDDVRVQRVQRDGEQCNVMLGKRVKVICSILVLP